MDVLKSTARPSGNGESPSTLADPGVPSLILPEDVQEFQEILRREFGEDVPEVEAWARLSDLVTLVRMLLGPLPEDPSVGTSSNVLQP